HLAMRKPGWRAAARVRRTRKPRTLSRTSRGASGRVFLWPQKRQTPPGAGFVFYAKRFRQATLFLCCWLGLTHFRAEDEIVVSVLGDPEPKKLLVAELLPLRINALPVRAFLLQ